MFGIVDEGSKGKKRKKRKNLEFDFAGGSGVSQKAKAPQVKKKTREEVEEVKAVPVQEVSKDKQESKKTTFERNIFGQEGSSGSGLKQSKPASAPRAVDQSQSTQSKPDPQIQSEVKQAKTTSRQESIQKEKPEPKKENTDMAYTKPTRVSNASSNAARQAKEQRTVNTFLSGVGLTLVCSIVLVASLAGLGGYVLWKQISDQSATLAMYETNTKERLFTLEYEFAGRDKELAQNLEAANKKFLALSGQFEKYKSETTETIAEIKASNKSLERSLNYYRSKVVKQEVALAKLQDRRSLFRR